jgi:hypothetical protein
MTFDELWRLDLARDRGLIESVDKTKNVALVERQTSADHVLHAPDEEEANRFLEWLEESMRSCVSG